MKNTQYNPYLWPNRRNVCILKEIDVGKHDDDVGCAMHPAIRNSSFIVDVAVGQIPRSTERISSYYYKISNDEIVSGCQLELL